MGEIIPDIIDTATSAIIFALVASIFMSPSAQQQIKTFNTVTVHQTYNAKV